jgi:hypothetical protein
VPERVLPLDSGQDGQSEFHLVELLSADKGNKMQQALTILMLLILVGSFLMLAGLVFFSESIIRSRPES